MMNISCKFVLLFMPTLEALLNKKLEKKNVLIFQ